MRARDLHPLCCLPVLDCPRPGWCSPPRPSRPPAPIHPHPPAVEGLLYKWTNIGKGWRPRWFAVQGSGALSYSKILRRRITIADGGGARLIGPPGYHAGDGCPIGFVYLKISSFRESKSDDKRFYIITPTKTLQLRTDSAKDRVAWIEALVSARSESSPNGGLLYDHNDVSFSTERLRSRMHAEGLGEEVIKDCEQIVHSEFSQYYTQMKQRCEEYLSFLGSLPQQSGVTFSQGMLVLNADDSTHSIKPECSCSGHGKCSESSNSESSDDVGGQELDELSDEDDYYFCDTRQSFSDSTASPGLRMKCLNSSSDVHLYDHKILEPSSSEENDEYLLLSSKRRTKLPKPVEKEKGVSLWSIIKDNVGKDLTRICLPVYFNEPISSLQKCFEDLEYSHLLDLAYEYGQKGNSLMRILCVAAFAVSGYASSDGHPCKPFNPLLGETYEADYPENGVRFFSEKVSHHPMVMACHCEGKGWKFWGESNVKSKFWGQTIQLDPVGVLTLNFDDGDTYKWSKVTTTINNLVIGRLYCHHHGTMIISGNRQYSCKLTFKQQSFLERNPRQVQGFVQDIDGTKVATLTGKWDESIFCTVTNETSGVNSSASGPSAEATLLWERNGPPANPTRYNLSSFAITLNELTPKLKEKLPPTDSRLRPDQRHVENGEYDKAYAEKLRLETRQRMARKMQENGWKPRWFKRDSDDGTFRYAGGYWEAREQGKWDGCCDIFGEFTDRKLQTSTECGSV